MIAGFNAARENKEKQGEVIRKKGEEKYNQGRSDDDPGGA